VRANGKRWRAEIRYDSKQHLLGTFDTEQEAALAYDKEARQCGEDKPLNYETIAAAEEAAAQAQAKYRLLHDMLRPRPSSGFYGVSANGKQWRAEIRYDSKQHRLGGFDTKQEAALAYDKEARQRGGDKPLNYETIAAAEEAAAQAQTEYAIIHPKQPKPRPASGFYGVKANKKKWSGQIYYSSKQHFLGSFDTKQEAAFAYDREARQCGEDKPLNYESIAVAEEAAAAAAASAALAALSVAVGRGQGRGRGRGKGKGGGKGGRGGGGVLRGGKGRSKKAMQ
jgi:hypothetical protein